MVLEPGALPEALFSSLLTTDGNLYGYGLNNPTTFVDPRGENPLLIAAGVLAAAGAIGIGVPLGLSEALGDECQQQETRRAAAQAAVTVGAPAAALALAGGAAEAAPAVAAAGLANAAGLTQGAQNALPRLPSALDRAAGVANDILDAAGDALGDLFGPAPDCECPSGQ